MRVALFARVDTSLNPYMLLYKEALESQGLVVHLEHEYNLKWLMTKGKSCDIIHLHWMEAAYKPSTRNTLSGLGNKLLYNRSSRMLRGIGRLIGFSIALLLAKLQGKMIVYTAHNLAYSGQFRPFAVLNRVAHYVVVSLADHIHAHNHYTRRILEVSYNRRTNVTVIPHGNYIGCYPNQVPRGEARRQLELPDDAFVYLFLGLLRPYKGVEDLIDAFEELESPRNQLLIAGRASNASYKEKLVCLVASNPAIRLVPEFIPDDAVQLYMNACDVCVLPYKDITTSGAAILALTFGRPVIAPAIASFPELVTPETGILYDPFQPDALAAALQHSRQRPWSEAEILDRTHQFDWDKLGPRLAALYKSSRQRQSESPSGDWGHDL